MIKDRKRKFTISNKDQQETNCHNQKYSASSLSKRCHQHYFDSAQTGQQLNYQEKHLRRHHVHTIPRPQRQQRQRLPQIRGGREEEHPQSPHTHNHHHLRLQDNSLYPFHEPKSQNFKQGGLQRHLFHKNCRNKTRRSDLQPDLEIDEIGAETEQRTLFHEVREDLIGQSDFLSTCFDSGAKDNKRFALLRNTDCQNYFDKSVKHIRAGFPERMTTRCRSAPPSLQRPKSTPGIRSTKIPVPDPRRPTLYKSRAFNSGTQVNSFGASGRDDILSNKRKKNFLNSNHLKRRHPLETRPTLNNSSAHVNPLLAPVDHTTSTTSTTSTASMHLPLHTRLPDGTHVTVDEATDLQLSEMYTLIQEAAENGEGYGVDEYPTEAEFREEIKGGHSFVVTARDVGNEDGDDNDDEEDEIEKRNSNRGSDDVQTGRMLAAFSLANSKFYRGNDYKVADPIVIVRREERRKGVGEFLFRHAVQFSRRLGYTGIYTDTFCNNTAMIRIIERSPGFQLVGFLPLGGKMPDGSFIGASIYFKDLREVDDSGSSR